MGKLFGTDGIRGKANTYPMTPEMALNVGRAVARFFKKNTPDCKIIIGKDTRISGDMLEGALAAGICAAGCNVLLAGVLPTPGIAHLASRNKAAAGIVISASHNPFEDNGIKLFNSDGYKLSDTQEAEIESYILDPIDDKALEIGRYAWFSESNDQYVAFLKNSVSQVPSFSGVKIILDCANGATSRVAPVFFNAMGARVETIFDTPDGKNINNRCGSQHPEALAKTVVRKNAQIGFAFDGDGDRLIVVDELGNVLTGDQILAICAKHLKQTGELKNNTVVSTVMSNLGLREALNKLGVNYVATQVGDRYVMQEMVNSGAILGGEDSGHMIFLNHHTTGDGIIAAIKVVEIMLESGKSLSELAKVMNVFPQCLINITVNQKPALKDIPEITEKICNVEKTLGDKGRVLVRYSGTQPICRVMVEGPTEALTTQYCRQIADTIQQIIGG